jgi:hypothetical protein
LWFSRLAVVLTLAAGTVACGYSLAGRGSFLPEYVRTVGVLPLENSTTWSRVEQVVTDKIRTEFINRGKYEVVSSASGAHAVLTGAITSISATPVGFTERQLASRYMFTVTLRVQFTDATTNQVLWENPALTFREEYDLGIQSNTALEGAAFLDQEGPAFDRIANDVARRVVSAILEAF